MNDVSIPSNRGNVSGRDTQTQDRACNNVSIPSNRGNVSGKGKSRELGPLRKTAYPQLSNKLVGDTPPVPLGNRLSGNESLLRQAVPAGIYYDALGQPIGVTEAVANHILEKPETRWDGRERYFPLIPDIIQNPQEIWVGFMQFEDSGRVYLRKRYVKAYEIEKGRVAGVLADTVKGQMIAFDVFHSKDMSGGGLRSGKLVYPME